MPLSFYKFSDLGLRELKDLVLKRTQEVTKGVEICWGPETPYHQRLRDYFRKIQSAQSALIELGMRTKSTLDRAESEYMEEIARLRAERAEEEKVRRDAQKAADRAYTKACLAFNRKPWFVRIFTPPPRKAEVA
jgi:hypothetical protein